MSVPSNMVPVGSRVTWAMSGNRRPVSLKNSTAAIIAIFVWSRSWQVSIKRPSTPPAMSPLYCSL